MVKLTELAALVDASRDDLVDAMERLTAHLDFERYALQVVDESRPAGEQWTHLANSPEGWSHIRSHDVFVQDPVCAHFRYVGTPLVWNQDTYTNFGAGHIWEHQSPYGYGMGVVVTHHLDSERHLVVGLDRGYGEKLTVEDPLALQAISLLSTFAAFAHRAAQRELLGSADTTQPPRLTRRETEVLRLTLANKTGAQVADILQISTSAVSQYVKSICTKLNVPNKQAAVAKAIKLGMG